MQTLREKGRIKHTRMEHKNKKGIISKFCEAVRHLDTSKRIGLQGVSKTYKNFNIFALQTISANWHNPRVTTLIPCKKGEI